MHTTGTKNARRITKSLIGHFTKTRASLVFIVIGIVFFSANRAESMQNKNRLPIILAKTLLVGASVSADYMASSPGKILAYRFGGGVTAIAAWGAQGAEIWSRVGRSDFANATTVIGIDLFFWDSVNGSLGESLPAIKGFIQSAKKLNLPLVLGDIPQLFASQPLRQALNARIRSECATYERCRVIGLSDLYQQIRRNGGMKIQGRFYTESELLPDELHISRIASTYIATKIAEALESMP